MHAAPAPLTRCRALALMVDGENLASDIAPRLLAAAANLGTLTVARVYGNAGKLNGWTVAPGFRVVHAHAGKNVTDMLLAVEAMELALDGRIDGLALATGDGDFTPLAQALRARGLPVWVVTDDKVPAHLVAACTAHIALALPKPPAPKPPAPKPPAPKPPAPKPAADARQAAIRAALATPLAPGAFGHAMHRAGYPKPEGAARWESWLKANAPYVAITGAGEAKRFTLA